MGANDFSVGGRGKDAMSTFNQLVDQAQWEDGHGGYTGTIAEKHSYVLIKDTPEQIRERLKAAVKDVEKSYPKLLDRLCSPNRKVSASGIAQALIVLEDPRIDDKWGPAGCIEVSPPSGDVPGEYLFFGWASS